MDASPTSKRRFPRFRLLENVVARILGRRLFAIAALTLKATFRYRLIQVLLLLLTVAVVGLPAIVKHDGTPQGFTQILLTYTLGSITILLGFATLWLGCGTLSRDVEECQIQMVAVKPVARWEIWVGKWIGILSLNAMLLTLAGATAYGLLQWRASRLPGDVQEELRQRIFTARASIRPAIPQAEIDAEAERLYQERLSNENIATMDRTFVRTQIVERVKAQYQIVPPGAVRRWTIDLGSRTVALQDQPLSIRAKFFSSSMYYLPSDTTFQGEWEIGPANGFRYRSVPMSLAADTFHELVVPPGYIDGQGILTIDFYNANNMALLFSLDDGIEVLYPEAGFGTNFIRGLGIIFCWLALLAAIGLAAGSFLSFPVAAFAALGILLVASSTGTLGQIITERGITAVNPDTGRIDNPALLDRAATSFARGLLWSINVVRDFSPVDALSTGRSVTWGQLGRAFGQIVVFVGGLFAALGVTLFTRRELATAQGN